MKNDPHSLRIAHLSDPHFSLVSYHPSQFLSKRWLGNLNLMVFRQHVYHTEHLGHLPELFETLDVERILLTGDLSSTAQDCEFALGQKFVESFKSPIYVIPGNHDKYTKKVENTRRFYDFFPSKDLAEKKVAVESLGKGWWWVGMDTALATFLFQAYGVFDTSIEKALIEALDQIPKTDRILLANHFPLWPSKVPSHDLKNAKRLREILKDYPQVKIYLHGHDHKPYIFSDRKPLVLNSGSCAHKPGGTFYLIDLYETDCFVQRLYFKESGGECSWVIDWGKQFTFD